MKNCDLWWIVAAAHIFISAPCIGMMVGWVISSDNELFRFMVGGVCAAAFFVVSRLTIQAVNNAIGEAEFK